MSNELISIRDVLRNPQENQNWFYLPPDKKWTLDTLGVFSSDSAEFEDGSDEWLPKEAKEDGWVEVLDGVTIEDICEDAKDQLGGNAADEQLFEAFVFYFENDAFIEF